jgi:hypothetical protein
MHRWLWLAVLIALPALSQETSRPLAAINPLLQQYEDGPAVARDFKFLAGETVFFSFQVQGYRVSSDEKVLLSYRIRMVDSDQLPLAEPQDGKLENVVTSMDQEWLPRIRYSILVPPYVPPGTYRILAVIKDEVGGKEAEVSADINIDGYAVERSDTLVLRNFRFLPAEDSKEALRPAVYKSGSTMWARFDVTGYKIGEKNHVRVAYGMSILSPAGKELYVMPEAAVEDETPFYPKRYISGIVSLNVQPNTSPGEYVLVLKLRDEEGNQTFESRQQFRVQ